MTRKDYVAFAKALDYQRQVAVAGSGENDEQTVINCAVAIAHVCMVDNPKFDKARFLKACGAQS